MDGITITQVLLAVTVLLLSYVFIRWYKDPIRRIPGPPGLPIFGNALSLNPLDMHNQFYEMARKYGAVMKVKIFYIPIVVLNSTDACMEALVKTGTDFQGRPLLPRTAMIVPKDVIFLTLNADQILLRRTFTKAIKAYGPGIAHLENIMQETLRDIVDNIQQNDGEPIDTDELANGYVYCILASMMFGEKYTYDDEVCKKLQEINELMIKAGSPFDSATLLDAIPFLMKFKFIFPNTHRLLEESISLITDFTESKIHQARSSFDANNKRGCLDYFIDVQQQEVDENGKQLLDDEGIRGLLINFLAAGLETSRRSLAQAFLDLLHDLTLQKKLQAEIDSQFEPNQTITLKDKEKLPQLEAYMYENLRYLSQVPIMAPHMTIRDTQVAGYKIPIDTMVLMNAYHTAHNPDVYDEPFKVKPDRFLDQEGHLVDHDHPLRQNFIGFGAGRRGCPGELLAKSRIFLFLANILQKFNIEPVGELPDRDVRKYPMSFLLTPPAVTARFVRRQQ